MSIGGSRPKKKRKNNTITPCWSNMKSKISLEFRWRSKTRSSLRRLNSINLNWIWEIDKKKQNSNENKKKKKQSTLNWRKLNSNERRNLKNWKIFVWNTTNSYQNNSTWKKNKNRSVKDNSSRRCSNKHKGSKDS